MAKTRKQKIEKYRHAQMPGVQNIADTLMSEDCVREVRIGIMQRVSSSYQVGSVIRSTRPANGGITVIYVGKPKAGQLMTVYPVEGRTDDVYKMLRSQYGI